MKISNIFENEEKILCSHCGKDLMLNIDMSIVQIVEDMTTSKITRITPCCKQACDEHLSKQLGANESDGWKELSEFINPLLHLQHQMAIMNSMFEGIGFANEEAFANYKNLIIRTYSYISRDLTENEITEAKHSQMMPF